MTELIREKVTMRQITRLCHFTPSRNLLHIASDPNGILSTVRLRTDEKAVFNATDIVRYDGFPDHVCCSIQYPNAWYFRTARNNENLFADWVVLFIKPDHLWAPGTKFSERNASANRGAGVAEGGDAFDSLFRSEVPGAYGRVFNRTSNHPSWLPTDEQAEVLIPDRVAREDILGVAVADESQAKREISRLKLMRAVIPPIFVAPDFFRPDRLSTQLRRGTVPHETLFHPGGPL